MKTTIKTWALCTLAAVVLTGCGRAGSPRPEAPAPEDPPASVTATGAVTTYIPTEAHANVSRVGDMLIGRVPGLEVRRAKGGYVLRIRGPRSLTGTAEDEEPLLVLDGSPVPKGSLSAALDALHPRDIARVDVLRDASSAAVYGMRGANGVIVITTKRPR